MGGALLYNIVTALEGVPYDHSRAPGLPLSAQLA